ncbi:hypothetical protein [Nocardioides zhouii]|uniref:Uncharacterized protein n=1 Tax=Nocardioides zhouii TaxID=1168729 RepID=A0A4Q2SNH5_9ACTN|nr:hypothetical protein [Nocardioides zhouii]RYC05754.1 hypothetical protein EUA94_17800 [Nocardioides zhouii]
MPSEIDHVVADYRAAEAALQALLRRADELETAQTTVMGARASLTEAADSLLASERALVDGTSGLASLSKELAKTGQSFRSVAETLGEMDQASLLEVNEQTQAAIHEVGTAVRVGLADFKRDVTTGTSRATELSDVVRQSVESQESTLVEMRGNVATLRDRILGLEGRVGEVGSRVAGLSTRLSQVQERSAQIEVTAGEISATVSNLEKRAGLILALVVVSVVLGLAAIVLPMMM